MNQLSSKAIHFFWESSSFWVGTLCGMMTYGEVLRSVFLYFVSVPQGFLAASKLPAPSDALSAPSETLSASSEALPAFSRHSELSVRPSLHLQAPPKPSQLPQRLSMLPTRPPLRP